MSEYELAVMKQEREQEARKVARSLIEFTNGLDRENAAHFVDEIMREHRTVQQKVFGLFSKLVKAWAGKKASGDYDARNTWTVEKSEAIWLGPLDTFDEGPVI